MLMPATGIISHAVHAVQWQESGQKAGHIGQQGALVQKSASLLQKAQQRFGPIPLVRIAARSALIIAQCQATS